MKLRRKSAGAGRMLKRAVKRLFDARHYREALREAGSSRALLPVGLLGHFLSAGMNRGIDPHPLFETRWYLDNHKDVADSGQPAFAHYARYGVMENRQAHPLFDPDWYMRVNPDVRAGGQSALVHFLLHGLPEGRDPNPFFDSRWYAETNPDVARSGLTPFMHFLQIGRQEGRDPHPLFDSRWYKERYPEITASRLAPYDHFMRIGAYQGLDPHPLFDTDYCLSQYGAYPSLPPAFAFLTYGKAAGLSPTPLFDPDYYADRNGDAIADDETPFEHFLRRGLAEDRSPMRIFDADWYRQRHGDLEIGPSAFDHFLRVGAYRDLDPHPLFDTEWYRRTYADRLSEDEPPFFHYLANGDLRPNVAFDPGLVAAQISDRVAIFSESRLQRTTGSAKASVDHPKNIIFTSIARNYLPHVMLLAESVKAANPDAHFIVVLCDTLEDLDVRELEHIDEIVTIDMLVRERPDGWIFQHTIVELCTAVKGPAIEAFLQRSGCETVVYLDPDIWVYGSLEPVYAALAQHSAVLTPHLLTPETSKSAIQVNEFDALRHGAFNLGFLAVRNDAAGRQVASWWSARLQAFCFDDRRNGLFVDQKWMDLAPGFFPQIGVLRHPGCNVAPWNLSQRRLAGDLSEGFTVNGEPLVFFHFSGKLNGSGAGMLKTFAGDNAAALLLDDMYSRRLAMEIAIAGSTPPWTFGRYDNGEPVTAADRRLYRKRTDVQVAFPNPLSTRGAGSFLHWHRRIARGPGHPGQRHEAPVPARRSLLEAYLLASESRPVQPCRLFDPAFYLRASADVARAGMDPYAHFVRHGLAEGRRCCATLDLGFYAAERGAAVAEPKAVFEDAMRNGIDAGVRSVPFYDETFDGGVLEQWRQVLANGKPTILMVCHYGGGGTSKNIGELTDTLASQANFILLNPTTSGTVSLKNAAAEPVTLLFDQDDLATRMADVVRSLPVDRVHVHHGFGLEQGLAAFLEAVAVPHDVTLHDTYFLTPNPFFTHDERARSRPGLLSALADGVANPIGRSLIGLTVEQWRRQFESVVQTAERRLAPSRSIASIYAEIYPDLDFTVVPNLELDRPDLPLIVPPLQDGRLTIAFTGDLQPHKGSGIVVECALLAQQRGLPFRFLVIGECGDAPTNASFEVTGSYLDRDLPNLLRHHGVHVMWLPFRAPESYSYVLTVGLWSGLALATTDVGSLPERLEGAANAHVLPVAASSDDWLSLFERIRQEHLTGSFRSSPRRPTADTFYGSRYIEPARQAAERRMASSSPSVASNFRSPDGGTAQENAV